MSRDRGVGAQQRQVKRQEEKNKGRRRRRKNGSGQRGKPSTPTQAIDALIGEEEQNGKQKEEQKKKQGAGPQPSCLGLFAHLLRPSWIIQ